MTTKKLTPKQALQAECKRLKVPFEKDNNMKTLRLLIAGELKRRELAANKPQAAAHIHKGGKLSKAEETEDVEVETEEEIQLPFPAYVLSFERTGEVSHEHCYFYDLGDFFIRTSNLVTTMPETGQYKEFPKSEWTKEYIIHVYTGEKGWMKTN